jgi:hypothetical protein
MPATSTWQWRSPAVTGASESLLAGSLRGNIAGSLRGNIAESLRGDARLLSGDVARG